MSTSAQYASVPSVQSGSSTTADTSTTQPTETTVGTDFVATGAGARIDQLTGVNSGTSVAGLVRFWKRAATAGAAVTSITNAATTATVTTTTPHGLSTGARVSVRGAFPVEYNVTNVAITVTSATVFTYTMTATTITPATGSPAYGSAPTTPVYSPLGELPIQAVVGSTTVPAYAFQFATGATGPGGNQGPQMPILLGPWESLHHTVTVTQTNALQVTAQGGNLS